MLEQRTPLNGDPIATVNPPSLNFMPTANVPAPSTSPSDPASAGATAADSKAAAPASAAPVASTNQQQQVSSSPAAPANNSGATPSQTQGSPIDLLFDPHQPKSGLPADVTFGGGPPLQQGAPPRFSYNLEDNITGAGQLGPESLLVSAHGTDIAGTFANQNTQAYVAGTQYGVPNFSFGPDTWVFGPQQQSSPQIRTANRPIRATEGNESGQLPGNNNLLPAQQGGASDNGQNSINPSRQDDGAMLMHEELDLSEQELKHEARPQSLAWAVFGDEDFMDELALTAACKGAAPFAWTPRPAEKHNRIGSFVYTAEPLNAPSDDRVGVLGPAALAASALAPAAVSPRERVLRNPRADQRGWSRPTPRFEQRPDQRFRRTDPYKMNWLKSSFLAIFSNR